MDELFLFCFENNDGVAMIRLNDPERLNALTFQTYAELEKSRRNWPMTLPSRSLCSGTGKDFCSGGRVDDIIGPLLKMKGAGPRLEEEMESKPYL